MAGDWIKMRVWIARDPRVIKMADYLAEQRPFMNWLTDPVQKSCKQSAYEHVTRNVTVSLCVTGLIVTWGTAREQGDRIDDDLVLKHCDKYTLDAITDIQCFGEAMEHVGWIVEHKDGSIIFPKFFKDNESPDERHKRQNAERQARHRAKLVEKSNVSCNGISNVTENVTVTTEKRREEKSKQHSLSEKPDARLPDGFAEFWNAYPRKIGKADAAKAWKSAKINGCLPDILAAIKTHCQSEQWQKDGGQYIPYPATWIRQERWNDVVATAPSISDWTQDPIFAGGI